MSGRKTPWRWSTWRAKYAVGDDIQTTLDEIVGLKILQPARGYRFSIDALLLAHFVGLKNPKRSGRGVMRSDCGVMRIADLGAGSGVIGIALAARFLSARVTLVEVQEALFGLSVQNIALNGLQARVDALGADIREIRAEGIGIQSGGFDLVVSNPPFRKPGTGKTSPCNEKLIARHEALLTLPELFGAAEFLLKLRGRFCFIHHVQRFVEVVQELKAAGLEPKRARFVHGRADTEARMFMMEAVRGGRPQFTLERPFILYDAAGEYTEEAQGLF
jgi:tRNA1Val (adenine37-N6)-methyltransferase